eukprot:5122818-Pyramimonas_sp.AAC.1
MTRVLLGEGQVEAWQPGDVATVRVHVSAEARQAVLVERDDVLIWQCILNAPALVAAAVLADVVHVYFICFPAQLLLRARNVTVS